MYSSKTVTLVLAFLAAGAAAAPISGFARSEGDTGIGGLSARDGSRNRPLLPEKREANNVAERDEHGSGESLLVSKTTEDEAKNALAERDNEFDDDDEGDGGAPVSPDARRLARKDVLESREPLIIYNEH